MIASKSASLFFDLTACFLRVATVLPFSLPLVAGVERFLPLAVGVAAEEGGEEPKKEGTRRGREEVRRLVEGAGGFLTVVRAILESRQRQ